MNPQNSPTSSSSGMTGSGGGSNENPGKVTQAKQAITQTAKDAATKVKTVASDATSRALSEAERLVADKKKAAAERVGGYSNSLHETARSFEENDPNIAHFTHLAADRIQGVADYIRNRDFAALREDCSGIARNHPAAFFGGLFVAGLLIGNMVKATARPRNQSSSDNGEADWRRQSADLEETMLQNELPMSTSPLPGTTPGAAGI